MYIEWDVYWKTIQGRKKTDWLMQKTLLARFFGRGVLRYSTMLFTVLNVTRHWKGQRRSTKRAMDRIFSYFEWDVPSWSPIFFFNFHKGDTKLSHLKACTKLQQNRRYHPSLGRFHVGGVRDKIIFKNWRYDTKQNDLSEKLPKHDNGKNRWNKKRSRCTPTHSWSSTPSM